MDTAIRGPAYRIHTKRMVLRCWEPADAPLLKEAIDASLEHLRPWMPWAKDEPSMPEAMVERLLKFRGEFDLGQNYYYGLFDRAEGQVLGGPGFHTKVGGGGLGIGYWIRTGHTNQGLATEATAALTKVAFEIHGAKRVEILCDSGNTRSLRVPSKLGFVHEATLPKRLAYPVPRDEMVWSLFAEDYPASPSAKAEIEAFDVIGRRLL